MITFYTKAALDREARLAVKTERKTTGKPRLQYKHWVLQIHDGRVTLQVHYLDVQSGYWGIHNVAL